MAGSPYARHCVTRFAVGPPLRDCLAVDDVDVDVDVDVDGRSDLFQPPQALGRLK